MDLENLPLSQFHLPGEDDSVVSLVTGAPGRKTLQSCINLFNKATQHRLNHTQNGSLFQYGPESGYSPFLLELVKFLNENYKDDEVPVKLDDLFLTAGATSGLLLSANIFLPPGRAVIFVENPTYFLALEILERDLGHRPVPVPMSPDGTGVDIDALEAAVEKEFRKLNGGPTREGNRFWAMYYTVPTYHNPTGSIMSPEKCEKVVGLARKYDFLVLCDDVYNLLHYKDDGNPPRRLFAYDRTTDPNYAGGNVISNGSFSKILTPGVRVGWIEAGPRLKPVFKNCGVLMSGGSMNNYVSGLVASAIKLGLQKTHLEYLRGIYKERMQVVGEVLNNELPLGFKCLIPHGGYFIWVTGTENFDSDKFKEHLLKEKKITFLPGFVCTSMKSLSNYPETSQVEMTNTELCKNAMRISVAHHEVKVLKKSISTLCHELKLFL